MKHARTFTGRAGLLPCVSSLVLFAALAGTAHAQQTVTVTPSHITLPPNPGNWPTSFDGIKAMGPYEWRDQSAVFAADPKLASAVPGGADGQRKLYICRSTAQDGSVHTGKQFDRQCNVTYGGKEAALTQGYQILVNTAAQLAPYLSQQWSNPTAAAESTFVGGRAANTAMRVCRASYANGVHPGKEWQGKCYIGWGGQEITLGSYQVLSLGFDKASWQKSGQSNSQSNSQTEIIVLQPAATQQLDTSKYDQLLKDGQPSPVVVAIDWQPGSLGKGFERLATYVPNLLRAMANRYNDTARKSGKDTLVRTPDQMLALLKKGDAGTQATMILLMVEAAGDILKNKAPGTWTAEERSFVKFLQALAMDQRRQAADNATRQFQDWELREMQSAKLGIYATINPAVNPPPEILALAQAGYAVTPETVENFRNILAAMSVPISLGVGAGATGIVVASGATASLMTVIAPNVSITLNIGASISRAAIPLTGAAGGIAVATLMIQAAIMKGIDVVKYEEYRTALNKAVSDSKATVSADDLKSWLQTTDGLLKLAYWLTAQGATGTDPATVPPFAPAASAWTLLTPHVNAVDAGMGLGLGSGESANLWVVGGDAVAGGHGIYKRNWKNGTWESVPGGAVRIDVELMGAPWIVNDAGEIFRREGKDWTKKFGPGTATDIGIGANGALWIVGTKAVTGGYGIYRWNAGSKAWDDMEGGGTRVDVDPQGNAWIVNKYGQVFRYTGSGWSPASGVLARDIGIGSDGSVFIAALNDGTVHKWNGSAWIKRDGQLEAITVGGNGVPFGANTVKAMWMGYP